MIHGLTNKVLIATLSVGWAACGNPKLDSRPSHQAKSEGVVLRGNADDQETHTQSEPVGKSSEKRAKTSSQFPDHEPASGDGGRITNDDLQPLGAKPESKKDEDTDNSTIPVGGITSIGTPLQDTRSMMNVCTNGTEVWRMIGRATVDGSIIYSAISMRYNATSLIQDFPANTTTPIAKSLPYSPLVFTLEIRSVPPLIWPEFSFCGNTSVVGSQLYRSTITEGSANIFKTSENRFTVTLHPRDIPASQRSGEVKWSAQGYQFPVTIAP
jgi:hypothetical protein